jgi:general secretion pathway protein G
VRESGGAGKKFPATITDHRRIFPTTFEWHGVFIPERLRPNANPTFFMKIQRQSSTFRRRSGFTLLEMVIVLGIIAMILGGAIFAMRGIGDAAKLRQVEADFKAFESALAMYKLNGGSYPTTQQGLKALVEKPSTTPVPRRWTPIMKKLPADPWGADYGYRFPGKKVASDFEMFSKGKDGMENTADDLSSQDD